MYISAIFHYKDSPCDTVQLCSTKHNGKTSLKGNRLVSDSLPSALIWFIHYVLYNCTTSQGEYLCNEYRHGRIAHPRPEL